MEFLKKLGRTKLIALGAGLILTLIVIITLVFSLSKPALVPLYSKLSVEDSNVITARLQAMNIPFSVSTEKNQILVPVDRLLGLRMTLAQEGLPSSGEAMGYEIFDKSDIIGTSQFVNNVNLVRALEGELARTISSLAPIEGARVHIVMPRNDLFSKTGPSPSASVVVKIRKGKSLNKDDINGIAHLLVTAIPDLQLNNVTILDQKGTPLKIRNEDEEEHFNDKINLYRTNIEDRLKDAVEDLLAKYVGYGKVKANVAATIDFNREVINIETYDPNGQVTRSQKNSSLDEKEGPEKDEDNVSVATNLPNVNQQSQQPLPITKTLSKSDEIINYEISKTISNKVVQWGSIKKLSVAVLVDGNYVLDEKTGKFTYQERSTDDLNKMKALVAAAIGIDNDRGDNIELISMPFSNIDEDNKENLLSNSLYDNRSLTQLVIIGTILLLAALLILRPLISKLLQRKKKSDQEEDLIKDLGEAMASTKNENTGVSGEAGSTSATSNEASLARFSERKYEDLINYLNSTIEKSPENAAIILRNWLYQESK